MVAANPTLSAPSASPIDSRLVVPFIKAVRQLFATMVKVEVKIEKPFLKTTAESAYDVAGIIGFSGEYAGSVAATFSMQAALKLVEAFCGMPLTPDMPDFADAIGELANMIAGSAKRELVADASITTPCVVIGKGTKFAPISGVACLVVPCTTIHGDFAIEVCIKRRG